MTTQLGVSVGAVSATLGTSNGGSPQCTFRAGRAKITGVIYAGPQPYFLLERTVVEYTQVFTPSRRLPAPTSISGLGLDAFWFPGPHQVMTTDGVRMITILIDWPGVSQARRRSLGIMLARSYLGPLHPKAADPGGG